MAAKAARRRDIGTRLERALTASATARGCGIVVIEADWTRWASVTFTGARHRLTLEAEANAETEAWLMALPELDLPLSGHLVADLQVVAVEAVDGRLRVTLEALTVEEC